MSYWPGQYDASDWGTSYSGHFMIEAEMKGYVLPPGFLENWKRYQRNKANAWSPVPKNSNYYWYNNDLEQAYRLYTLALAKAPELGAMNRLKEYPDLSTAAKWRLAAAYAKAGQPETAKKIIGNLTTAIPKYRELGYSYGSNERDEAMILETLTLLDMKVKAGAVLKEVCKNLSSGYWMSTQTTAYSLIAVSKFVGANGTSNEMRYNVKIDNQAPTALNTKLPVKQIDMQLKGAVNGNVTVTNSGTGILFARVILEGIPETGDQTSAENDLRMEVNYTNMQGGNIDVTKLEQGTDFIAEVTITNPGTRGEYLQMALTQIFPSGWEIHNTRMDEAESVIKSDYPTYQDIRDDRVYTYFDVSPYKAKVFRIVLNAAYIGKYYLPTVNCEAMYDNTINSRKPGKWVTVVKAGE
jgi:alpha-2-macroglobulin